MKTIGSSITANVGKPASSCSNPTHLHQSADLNGGITERNQLSGETCWITTDGWQCPDTYPDHYTCSSSSGTAGVSGNITEYICNSWSKETRGFTTEAFFVLW